MAGDFEGNPFANEEGINPFADPSVTQVTEPPPSSGQEEYNPFAEEGKPEKKKEEPALPRLPPPPSKADIKAKNSKAKAAKSKKVEAPPAIMQAEEDRPPAYSSGAGPFSKQDDGELAKREEEIAQRERDLQAREKNLERLGPIERPNNFPPFPAFCPSPLKPCFYININVEVPPPERWKMWALLALMIFTWVMLILNVFISIVGASVASDTVRNEFLTTMGVSILYLLLFVPGTLFCWFLPVYHAYRRDSSLAYMWFFFVMLFQILSYLLNGIGVPNLGACGFFNGSKLFGRQEGEKAAGAMYIIMGFLWLTAVPFTVLLLVLVHKYYRQSGGSLNRATEEAVSGAGKNKAVRGAVKSGVAAGVKATM
jgi:hypothetical protein